MRTGRHFQDQLFERIKGPSGREKTARALSYPRNHEIRARPTLLAISFRPRLRASARRAARLGRRGERVAARFLRREGLRILARNVRSGAGEIDLVALDEDTLVFVEVKSRGEGSWTSGFEAVDVRKARALRRACGAYLQSIPGEVAQVRIDVVAVEFGRGFLGRRVREIHWEPGLVAFGGA